MTEAILVGLFFFFFFFFLFFFFLHQLLQSHFRGCHLLCLQLILLMFTVEIFSFPELFLSCTTQLDLSSNEWFSQKGARSAAQSSQKQSTPAVTASGEITSVLLLSAAPGELGNQDSFPVLLPRGGFLTASLISSFLQGLDSYMGCQSEVVQLAGEPLKFYHRTFVPSGWYGAPFSYPNPIFF